MTLRILFVLILSTFFGLSTIAQPLMAKLKFEDAEKAYQAGEYDKTLSLVTEVEKMLNGTSPKTMYLRILASEKKGISDFAGLSALRKNCTEYLNKYGTLQELEDQYREVYEIQKGLDKYPSTELEYNTNVTRQLKAKELEEKRRRLQPIIQQLANATGYSINLGRNLSTFKLSADEWEVQIDSITKRVSYKRNWRQGNDKWRSSTELVFESAILVEYKYIWESNTKADYLGVLVDFTFPRIEEELLKKLNLSDKKVDEGHGFIKYRNNDFSLTKNIGFSYLGVSLSEVEKRRIEIVMNHGLSQDELQETDLGNISIYIQRDPDSQKSENRFLIIEHGKLHKNRKEFEVLKELGERLPTKANYNTQVTSQKKDKDLEEKRQRLKRLTTQLANATSYITNLGDSIYNFRCEKRNCKEYIDPTNKRVIYRYSGRYSRRGNTYISENVLELVFDSGILVEYKYIRDYNSEEYYLKSLYKEKFLKIEEELLIKLNLTGKISAKGEDFIQYKNDDFLLTKKIGFSSVLGTDERNITIAINHGLSQDELKKTDLGTFGIYIERDPYSKKSDQRFLIIEHGKLHQKL